MNETITYPKATPEMIQVLESFEARRALALGHSEVEFEKALADMVKFWNKYHKGLQVGNLVVISWWDRQSRNYITHSETETTLTDDAEFDGYKESAAVSFVWKVMGYANGATPA